MYTSINNEDRLVQKTIADYLQDQLGWETRYAWNDETFGPDGMLGRTSERDVVLTRDLRSALVRLNPLVPESAIDDAIETLTASDFSRSTLQHNQRIYRYLRDGVPVSWKDADGRTHDANVYPIDFRNPDSTRFLAVRELKVQGLRTPHYNRRADLVCFINGLPLVFFELKAVYLNIRAGFDNNITDYKDTIPHVFHSNAFLIVSNGDRARYGSITAPWEHFAEWKRNDEKDEGRLDTQALLDGMLARDRLLDVVENFILFDSSKPGEARKIVARNHQVLGVNRAVASVIAQETLKREFPPERRLAYRTAVLPIPERRQRADVLAQSAMPKQVPLVERAHPDLGRLGVFWHTQGSGKSYSMVFFAEKVRRVVPGNFTFVVMTDREDLDSQIYRTFIGTGVADEKTPRAGSGKELEALLKENHRFLFSLIHKFSREVSPEKPYSTRDDIIIMSDEAHRTQAGKLARNMRLALPNAAFIGFTGTPLFKHDQLTRRIFGDYVSRYDFKRSEEDGATVRLIYENRGEKLGIARLDLNDRIAEKVEEAELDPDKIALLEKLLGKDYEVITAEDRLDKIADDFVEHCGARWESGKAMLVCIDKVTCGRMHQRIIPRWRAQADKVRAEAEAKSIQAGHEPDAEQREKLVYKAQQLGKQADWMDQTAIEIIISEAQNEVKDFAKWGVDIRPHRERIKRGFETPDGRRVDIETAFKDPEHPFRVAIVCAMWLTGFDVECLSTLYIDKPMKARAGGADPVAPVEELIAALDQALEETEKHLRGCGFEPRRLVRANGFARIAALRDAVEACYVADEAKRRFEILARQVFSRFKALIGDDNVYQYAERHDNIEAIYKKLQERRDTSDVTDVLKELHRIVNAAIQAQQPGTDQAEGLTVDLSTINFEKLREEFAKRVTRKNATLRDVRDVVEDKLAAMLRVNPLRMDHYKRYQEIIADYNREKDRATVEATFRKLIDLAQTLDAEQRRAAEEGLSEQELALFDLLYRDGISKSDRERLKQASRSLLSSLTSLLASMKQWTEKEQTQADVRVFILDKLVGSLPDPPYSPELTEVVAGRVFDHIWQQSVSGAVTPVPTAA